MVGRRSLGSWELWRYSLPNGVAWNRHLNAFSAQLAAQVLDACATGGMGLDAMLLSGQLFDLKTSQDSIFDTLALQFRHEWEKALAFKFRQGDTTDSLQTSLAIHFTISRRQGLFQFDDGGRVHRQNLPRQQQSVVPVAPHAFVAQEPRYQRKPVAC